MKQKLKAASERMLVNLGVDEKNITFDADSKADLFIAPHHYCTKAIDFFRNGKKKLSTPVDHKTAKKYCHVLDKRHSVEKTNKRCNSPSTFYVIFPNFPKKSMLDYAKTEHDWQPGIQFPKKIRSKNLAPKVTPSPQTPARRISARLQGLEPSFDIEQPHFPAPITLPPVT